MTRTMILMKSLICLKNQLKTKLTGPRLSLDKWIRETKDQGFTPEIDIAKICWKTIEVIKAQY